MIRFVELFDKVPFPQAVKSLEAEGPKLTGFGDGSRLVLLLQSVIYQLFVVFQSLYSGKVESRRY